MKTLKKLMTIISLFLDTSSISKILYTKDFIEYKDLQDYNQLSNTFVKYGQQVTFNWHFYQLSGSNFNNIYLTLKTDINEFYEKINGIVKFNGDEFQWVISNTDNAIY